MKTGEFIMARKYIDCREMPSDSHCTVTIAADSERELLEVAVQHAVAQHGHTDTPKFRSQLKEAIREGRPPA
jgi:predicted small metal-binding protein